MNAQTSSVAVLYHYFEAKQNYRDNLVFFLECGWLDNVDYYLICSSECSVDLPRRDNLHVIEAPNLNLDYGGYCHAVAQYGEILAAYDTLFFVNCSVRGPFMPHHSSRSWCDVFTDRLDDDVHMVGSSHNFLPSDRYSSMIGRPGPFPHLQTTAYALTRTAFLALKSAGFYDQRTEKTKSEIIAHYEIGLTDFILKNGWNISSILPCSALDDPNIAERYPNFSARNGDPLGPDAYFGRTVDPEEVIFIKTNRRLLSERELAALTFSHLLQRSKQAGIEWQPSEELLDRSYRKAKKLHEEMKARRSGFRNKLRGKVIRLLDKYM